MNGASPTLAIALQAVIGFGVLAGVVAFPSFRITALVLGGLFGLVPGSAAGPYGLFWLLLMGVALGASIPSLTRRSRQSWQWGRVTTLGLVWLGYALVSLMVAVANSASIVAMVSSGLVALMIPLAVWIGIAAAPQTSIKLAMHLAVLAALVSAAAYAAFWSGTRTATGFGAGDIPVFALASLSLSTLGLALAMANLSARGLAVPIRLLYAAVAGVIAILLLLSGNRTVLLALIGASTALFFGARRGTGRRSLAWAVVGLSALFVIGAFVFPTLAAPFGLDTSTVTGRFETVLDIADSGIAADRSGASRLAIYESHTTLIQQNPIIGIGPGGVPVEGQVRVDSPLVTVVRYGVLGTILLATFLFTFFRTALAAQPPNMSGSVWSRAIKGWLVAQLLVLPLQSHLDDKGLVLVILLIATAMGRPARPVRARPARSGHYAVSPSDAAVRQALG